MCPINPPAAPAESAADFIAVAAVDTLSEGQIVQVRVAQETIAIAVTQGRAHAFQSLCPHDKAGLALGDIKGCELRCPRHFARFDLRTGAVSAGWTIDPLRIYPARIRAGMVEVDAAAVRRNPPEGEKEVWSFI